MNTHPIRALSLSVRRDPTRFAYLATAVIGVGHVTARGDTSEEAVDALVSATARLYGRPLDEVRSEIPRRLVRDLE